MKVKFALDTLGILTGDEKRALEDYVDSRLFRQRKWFDEWVVHGEIELDIDLCDLMILADKFIVEVCSGGIALRTTI